MRYTLCILLHPIIYCTFSRHLLLAIHCFLAFVHPLNPNRLIYNLSSVYVIWVTKVVDSKIFNCWHSFGTSSARSSPIEVKVTGSIPWMTTPNKFHILGNPPPHPLSFSLNSFLRLQLVLIIAIL